MRIDCLHVDEGLDSRCTVVTTPGHQVAPDFLQLAHGKLAELGADHALKLRGVKRAVAVDEWEPFEGGGQDLKIVEGNVGARQRRQDEREELAELQECQQTVLAAVERPK